jgi:predicted ATPase/transcriptional regulator with XRE-family HTH domain
VVTSPPYLASILRNFRRSAGLTEEELADRANLSVRTISDLERGLKVTPQSGTVELLADALALSPGDRETLLASVPRRRHRPRTPDSVTQSGHLPIDVTPLIGRERDEATAAHVLGSTHVRLLTLVGPGGVGKTRLAARVAGTVAGDYADGVAFVALATLMDPSGVPSAIAGALGIRDERGQVTDEKLSEWLQGREILLVLDNFEHLTHAALIVSELLQASERLSIIVTSRVPLHLRGENILDVPPLTVPAVTDHLPVEVALRHSAIALFVQRAQAVRPTFALTDDTVAPVCGICRRLDGLPLAVELAAAQTRYMPVAVLLERLVTGVQSLPAGLRDLPARQRTMRDAIAWSYDLLTESEQTLFRRLAVFSGGSTLEAAAKICGEPESDTPSLLYGLVDKSLVVLRSGPEAEPRFTMLETVREYSMERASPAERPMLARRHADYFRSRAHEADVAQRSAGPNVWSARLLADQENLLAALRWLADNDLEEALKMAGALTEYWTVWGQVRLGRSWLEDLLARAAAGSDAQSVRVPSLALTGAARLAWVQADYARAGELYEQAVVAYRGESDRRGEGIGLSNLGTVAHAQADYARATDYYQQGLEIAREVGDLNSIGIPLTNLAVIAMQQGDFTRSAELHDEAMAVWREMGNDQKLAIVVANRSGMAYRQGEYDLAAKLQEEALNLKRAVGDKLATASSLGFLGSIEIERGNLAAARERLDEALISFHEAGQKTEVAACFEALARVALEEGDSGRAARLYGGAEALRESVGAALPEIDRPRYEAAVARLRAAMNSTEFRAAWETGRATRLDRLVDYALQQTRDPQKAT